jgi:hypothetical protein
MGINQNFKPRFDPSGVVRASRQNSFHGVLIEEFTASSVTSARVRCIWPNNSSPLGAVSIALPPRGIRTEQKLRVEAGYARMRQQEVKFL